MQGPLIDLIGELANGPLPAACVPVYLFADGGTDAAPSARAAICPADPVGSFACPRDPTLTYVLTTRKAADCVAVLEGWYPQPVTPQDRYAAVMFYARFGEWLLPPWVGDGGAGRAGEEPARGRRNSLRTSRRLPRAG